MNIVASINKWIVVSFPWTERTILKRMCKKKKRERIINRNHSTKLVSQLIFTNIVFFGSKNSILVHPLLPSLLSQPLVHFSPLVPTATLQSEKNKFQGAGLEEGEGIWVKTVKSQ